MVHGFVSWRMSCLSWCSVTQVEWVVCVRTYSLMELCHTSSSLGLQLTIRGAKLDVLVMDTVTENKRPKRTWMQKAKRSKKRSRVRPGLGDDGRGGGFLLADERCAN